MKIIGIIPARYASTRFPGKPIHPIAGKPLVQHVVERCREAKLLSDVILATDDERIAEVAKELGVKGINFFSVTIPGLAIAIPGIFFVIFIILPNTY